VTENQKQIVITDGGEELSFDGTGGEHHIVYGDAEQVCLCSLSCRWGETVSLN
jgi:hypothetical protein